VRELKAMITSGSAGQLDSSAEAAISALQDFRDWLEHRLPVMTEEMGVGREGYSFFLRNVALMPFAPEQLLVMGAQEWERSIAFEALASERAKGAPELELVPDQAIQMIGEKEAEQAIRRFLEAENILTVPSWMAHYRNLPVPAYIEPLAELSVLDDLTSATRLGEDGLRYIPKPSGTLGYFERSAAIDPRPLIVHEGVPGHFFQFSLS
jgi:uncharacterized protein (DUF885 family)